MGYRLPPRTPRPDANDFELYESKTFARDGKIYPYDQKVEKWYQSVSIKELRTDGPEINEEFLAQLDARADKHFNMLWRRALQAKWKLVSIERTDDTFNSDFYRRFYEGLTLEGYISGLWQRENQDEMLTPFRKGNWFRTGRRAEPELPELPDITNIIFTYTATFHSREFEVNVK